MATSSRSEAEGRRRLRPAERRLELIDAAVDVLASQGPTATKVEDITSAAGTAKGNFYRYFDSVDDMIVAVRDHLLDVSIAQVAARQEANPDASPWEVIEREVGIFLDDHLSLGPLHDVLFHGAAANARPVAPERSAGLLLATLIEQGNAEGAFAVEDPQTTGELLFHAAHGATDLVRAGADRARVQQALLELFRRTLGLEQGPQSTVGQATPGDRS